MRLSDRAMRQQIASALNLVVQVARMSDGSRRVTSISEITGMEGETITMQEIFQYERTGVDQRGHGTGSLPSNWYSSKVRRTVESLRSATATRLLRGDVSK